MPRATVKAHDELKTEEGPGVLRAQWNQEKTWRAEQEKERRVALRETIQKKEKKSMSHRRTYQESLAKGLAREENLKRTEDMSALIAAQMEIVNAQKAAAEEAASALQSTVESLQERQVEQDKRLFELMNPEGGEDA